MTFLPLGTGCFTGTPAEAELNERKSPSATEQVLIAEGDSLPTGTPFGFSSPEVYKVPPPRTSRLDSVPIRRSVPATFPLLPAGTFPLPRITASIRPRETARNVPYTESFVAVSESGPVRPPANESALTSARRVVDQNNGFPSQQLYDSVADEDGTLWLSSSEGLIRYDGKRYELWRFENDLPQLLTRWTHRRNGWLWGRQDGRHQLLAFNGSTLRIYTFPEPVTLTPGALSAADDGALTIVLKTTIYAFDGQKLWVFDKPGDWSEWYDRYRFEGGRLIRYDLAPSLTEAFPAARILRWQPDHLVLGDRYTLCREEAGAMNCRRAEELPFRHIWHHLPLDDGSIVTQSNRGELARWGINSIVSDQHLPAAPYPNFPYVSQQGANGNVWLHSRLSGLHQFRTRTVQHQSSDDLGTPQPYGIAAISEATDGTIWLGSHGGPLVRTTESGRWAYALEAKKSLSSPVRALTPGGGDSLWIGTTSQGLLLKTGANLHRFDLLPDVDKERIFALTTDRNGRLWIGFRELGLGCLAGGKLTLYRHRRSTEYGHSDPIRALHCDRNGRIWAASLGGGLRCFDGGRFTYYSTTEGLSSNQLLSLAEDEDGNLWIGTKDAGVMRYDGKQFTTFDQDEGLSSNTIYTITVDGGGYVWLGADDCLNRLDFQSTQLEGLPGYTADDQLTVGVVCDIDGVRNNEFYANATLRDKEGSLWWGGNTVLHRGTPEDFFPQDGPPGLKLTGISLGEETVHFAGRAGSSSSQLEIRGQVVTYDSLTGPRLLPAGLRLPTRLNAIGFTFSPTRHARKERVRFIFRLLGAEQSWSAPRGEPAIAYRGLSPGKYTLQARVAGADNVWSHTYEYRFLIRAPWWQRPWAVALGAALLFWLLYLVYRAALRRRLRTEEARKVLEMDALRRRFYTNITHEFRTPLSVIRGVSKNLVGDQKAGQMIVRNADRLLRLINQLLDLAKLEAGNLPVHLVHSDIVAYCRYLTENCASLAEEKRQRLAFYPELQNLEMDFDPEKLQSIILNLLSNAIKFTPAGGQVVVHLRRDADQLRLVVQDNGPGIAADELPRVFDRFYRAANGETEGSGVGLAYTRQLVKLLGGDISLTSTEEDGTRIEVCLPVKHEPGVPRANLPVPKESVPPLQEELPAVAVDHRRIPEGKQEKDLLLLVEDNRDLTTYISQLLSGKYRLLIARDGEEGLELAREQVPDLVLSDVMMPRMDGFALCDHLKRDIRTSHIPIILLTAKTNQRDKVEGLTYGADAYLGKPFDAPELLVRIQNLIDLRRSLHGRPPAGEAQSPDPQQEFLRRVSAVVEGRLDDGNLTVPELARSVAMSQTQLYRKLKALTDRTPSQYIRTIRLEQGAVLLRETDQTISEIAYAVGFTDPNYFSRTFNDAFGSSPSDYRARRSNT